MTDHTQQARAASIPDAATEAAAEAFLTRYLKRSGARREVVLARRVVATCACGESICDGFQVIPEDCVLSWRGEEVIIRG